MSRLYLRQVERESVERAGGRVDSMHGLESLLGGEATELQVRSQASGKFTSEASIKCSSYSDFHRVVPVDFMSGYW